MLILNLCLVLQSPKVIEYRTSVIIGVSALAHWVPLRYLFKATDYLLETRNIDLYADILARSGQ
jgi:hypothetical protein